MGETRPHITNEQAQAAIDRFEKDWTAFMNEWGLEPSDFDESEYLKARKEAWGLWLKKHKAH